MIALTLSLPNPFIFCLFAAPFHSALNFALQSHGDNGQPGSDQMAVAAMKGAAALVRTSIG